MKKHLTNTIERDIRFSDVDSLGIVWHGHYIQYFEDGREAFGKEHSLHYLDLYREGYVAPVVNVQCDYKQVLRYGCSVVIETTYVPCEPARLNFKYRLLNAETGELVVTGATTQVFLSKDDFILQLTNPDFFKDWKKIQGLI